MMKPKPESGLFPVPPHASDLALGERRTPELVLGFVGPVGSGVTTTATLFANILENEFGYKAHSHKLSSIIGSSAQLVDKPYDQNAIGFQRITNLQDIGNCLRKKFGPSYISEKLVEKIATIRLDSGYDKTREPFLPLPLRHVHIIDSLKNPSEARLLRDIYEDTFWLVGVFAPTEVRKDRLKAEGVQEIDVQSLIARDEKEHFDYGQNVRDTIFEADFFVRNDKQNDDDLKKCVARFLDILFNVTVNTPTLDEAAMYTAVSAAATSACMSRQVGAAIYSKIGELIGVGSNDVPKFGGGLYRYEDTENDHRCYKWGAKICHNDDKKEKLYNRIAQVLKEDAIIKQPDAKKIRESLRRTEIRDLIEYSRAVHAEMEAIISVARSGKSGIVGSTLYCTTFPCHSCARHIVASGIEKVIYIEPYPKSLASELHKDSVSTNEALRGSVRFVQYDGVAPKNIIRFFKHGIDRKKDGKLVTMNRRMALPIHQPLLDGFAVREQMIVNRLANLEKQSVVEEVKGGR